MDIVEHINIDLLPVKLFCELYKKTKTTVYSWKCRNPELVGVVFFKPDNLEMHVSISGYEKWIIGELNNTQQASDRMPTASRSSSSGRKTVRNTVRRRTTGNIPQLI